MTELRFTDEYQHRGQLQGADMTRPLGSDKPVTVGNRECFDTLQKQVPELPFLFLPVTHLSFSDGGMFSLLSITKQQLLDSLIFIT